MIAAGDQHAVQVALLARHPVQRVDAAGTRDQRQLLGIGMHQQFGPRALDRQRLDFAAVPGQPPVLDQAATGEAIHGAPVCLTIERHRQVQVAGVDAQLGAGERDAFGVAGKLKFWRPGSQRGEIELTVGQDCDFAAANPAVHASGHLQDFVGSEIQPVQHVAPVVHDVAVSRVVDHHGVETGKIERRLTGRSHRQQVGLGDFTLEKGAQHADRLTAVIERGREARKATPKLRTQSFDLGSRGQEHRHSAPPTDEAPHRVIVEILRRLLREHGDLGLELRIERARLEHLIAAEVVLVDPGIDGGRQPDESASGPLSEREAEFELRRCLVNLVDDDGVTPGDQVVGQPAARDAGGHDDHVPAGCLGRRLAFAVHHADQQRLGENLFRDHPDAESLAGAGAGDDAKAFPVAGPLPHRRAMLALQQRVDAGMQGEFDRLARRASRCDDDDATVRMEGVTIRVEIRRKQVVASGLHWRKLPERAKKDILLLYCAASNRISGGVMQGKICLVTGANHGIGRATTEDLARQGAIVLMVCRNRERGERAHAEIVAATGNRQTELFIADLSIQAEVRQLVEDVKARHTRLDVLINNAGAFFARRTMTVDDVEATFAVNHLACFILVNGLADLLRTSAPARVVVVASEAHQRVSDPEDWVSVRGYNARTAYNRSKLANVIFSYDMAHRLEGTGVTVNSCHPGVVDTPVLRGLYDRWWSRWLWPIVRRFTITPEEGARTVLYLATSPDVEGVTGKYFKESRPVTSSLISHDSVIGARLWNLSLRLTGELPPVTVTGEIIAHRTRNGDSKQQIR